MTATESKNLMDNPRETLAASMLYEYRLGELGKEFALRNLMPVIVKGQAIVDLAFPQDEIRLSSDIDLLVGEDETSIAAALIEIGYQENPPHSRHFGFGERGFYQQHEQRLPEYVEVHRCLDKILLRPIPYGDILARAKPSGRAGFRYPAIEDLLLLVVLHASADIFFDEARIQRDLRFLIEHGKPDMDTVQLRAKQWGLSRALDRLSNQSYPPKTNNSHRWSTPKTVFYLANQWFWHDSPATFLKGLAKYSIARLLDRLFP